MQMFQFACYNVVCQIQSAALLLKSLCFTWGCSVHARLLCIFLHICIYIYAYACIQYTYVFLYRCIYSYMYIYIHVWYARTSTLEGCASHDPGAASHCMVQCSKKKFVPTKSQSKCLHVLRRTCTRQTRTYYVFLWTNWILCHSILEMVSYSIGWRNIT